MGILSSLLAAFGWAFAVSLFRDPILRHGAHAINLAKCTIAALLLGITVLIAGQGGLLFSSIGPDWWTLVISGIIGLTIGDTALFRAVATLGPPKTLLMQTTVPMITAVIAAVWMAERPTPAQIVGGMLVMTGVIIVIGEKPGGGWRRLPWSGIAAGMLYAVCQAISIVMSKAGMESYPILAASFLRIGAAALGLMVLVPFLGGLRRAAGLLKAPDRRRILGASFLGTYISILLMMAGVRFAPATLAAVLLSTTPIFSLFLDARMTGQPIRARGIAGTALAVVGVAVITLNHT